jgi:hypothetical protein
MNFSMRGRESWVVFLAIILSDALSSYRLLIAGSPAINGSAFEFSMSGCKRQIPTITPSPYVIHWWRHLHRHVFAGGASNRIEQNVNRRVPKLVRVFLLTLVVICVPSADAVRAAGSS